MHTVALTPQAPRHCAGVFDFIKRKKTTDESVGFDGTD
jgi:hypothetical protein